MSENERFKILVVDDEINNIDHLNRILAPMYDIIVAKNGGAAIKKAEKHLPDLILLDVIMPDMSGFEVISILKNTTATEKIPIIFITGLDSSENEEKGLLLGAVDYITKPFNNSIVRVRVKTHLQIIQYIRMIEQMCRVDALTNISNRRHFNSQLEMEWDRAARDSKPVSLLLIDIDHFKKYNDTYGHPQGDELLKGAAAIFSQSLSRPCDFVARWGGEEFAALLPDTDLNGALEAAEKIRNNVARAIFPLADGTSTNVTISIGVNTEIPQNKDGVESFIERADKALYTAKETGRNRVRHS